MIDADTEEPLPQSKFALDLTNPNTPKVNVIFTNPTDLVNSPYNVAIKADLNGFGTSVSAPIVVNVINPCSETTLVTQTINSIVAVLNESSPVTRTYEVFKDTVSQAHSATHGNGLGFGLCGPQEVTLL